MTIGWGKALAFKHLLGRKECVPEDPRMIVASDAGDGRPLRVCASGLRPPCDVRHFYLWNSEHFLTKQKCHGETPANGILQGIHFRRYGTKSFPGRCAKLFLVPEMTPGFMRYLNLPRSPPHVINVIIPVSPDFRHFEMGWVTSSNQEMPKMFRDSDVPKETLP